MHRDVAEQMQRLGHETRLKLRRLNRTITQPPGLVDQAKKQSGTAQHAVRAATLTDDPPCCVALNQLLALAEAGQRLASLADLCKDPSGGGDCVGKHDNDFPGPEHRDHTLDQ